ncbi:MAG: hypothetical protein ABSB59_23860, partial [Streptosporangiaceae bacterium]
YRTRTVQARTSGIQRLARALESAGIKPGPAAVMADLARGRARTAAKMADLPVALEGRFTGHHALMCRLIPDRIKVLGAAAADLDTRIRDKAAPWQREMGLLKTIPGSGDAVARAWIAGTGPDPHQ